MINSVFGLSRGNVLEPRFFFSASVSTSQGTGVTQLVAERCAEGHACKYGFRDTKINYVCPLCNSLLCFFGSLFNDAGKS